MSKYRHWCSEMEQLSLFDDQFDVLSADEELIEKLMLRGSNIVGGKQRIHEFVSEKSPTINQLAEYLKNEYGWGGYGGGNHVPNTIHYEMHDPKGIWYEGTDRDGKEVEGKLNWNEVAKVIIRMVEQGKYI